jgi:GGDEF domain-containing protein
LGALGGVLATALYAAGVLINPHIPTSELGTNGNVIRALSYVGIGFLVGWFAATTRTLTEQLRLLTKIDATTGIGNLRSFEDLITPRLDAGAQFTLFIADCTPDEEFADAQIQAIARRLHHDLGRIAEVTRTGPYEFAVIVPGNGKSAHEAARLEGLIGSPDAAVGWAVHPQDGSNALALHRAAVERLYVRRLLRTNREAQAANVAS